MMKMKFRKLRVPPGVSMKWIWLNRSFKPFAKQATKRLPLYRNVQFLPYSREKIFSAWHRREPERLLLFHFPCSPDSTNRLGEPKFSSSLPPANSPCRWRKQWRALPKTCPTCGWLRSMEALDTANKSKNLREVLKLWWALLEESWITSRKDT